jgi:Helicase HerA, central domain
MNDFEKLGQFYLGREIDLKTGETSPAPLMYDSRDLTTHAVVVGMTGSGKTGLCINLLEEAGMDRIPALVIDPKGDIANLFLTFPELTAASFRPWIDEGLAAREGITPDEFATREADKWEKGLAKWGQDAARIARLRETVELRLFTPGSNTGRPLTVLKSFSAPDQTIRDDQDALRERITGAVSGLLALLGIDADPIRSREHILLSNILSTAWSHGRDLNMGQLIAEIQNPPFQQVGIMELNAFFPAKERTELAMSLNNLLASPSFAAWMNGEPLDVKRLLYTPEGKPCISILSIAHLNDAERMFFVTLLLNEVLTWMRSQSGTSSLRAILYMDEVFGYFPPTANPPSKQPMLTLLKQARAFGLGVVLATQNPVDLDYKGLSNTGTWFLGRLQTERDKARVIEGLEGVASTTGTPFNRQETEQVLAGLGKRKFMMNNVHDNKPVVFETRWAMSYLRGPLARNEIQKLCGTAKSAGTSNTAPSSQAPGLAPAAAAAVMPGPAATAAVAPGKAPTVRPAPPGGDIDPRQLIPADISQRFVQMAIRPVSADTIVYQPALLATGRLHFVRATCKIDLWSERTFLASLTGESLPDEIWDKSVHLATPPDLDGEPHSPAEFAPIPAEMKSSKQYPKWEKELKDYLYRCQDLKLYRSNELKVTSAAGETRGDFIVRLEQLVSEHRDNEVQKLREKFGAKRETLRTRIRNAEDKLEKEAQEYKQKRLDSVLSVGGSLMEALLGRKTVSVTKTRRTSSSAKSVGRAMNEKGDVNRAEDNLADLQQQMQDLESEFNAEAEALGEKLRVDKLELEEISVPARKSDIAISSLQVVWLPVQVDSKGSMQPAWDHPA